MAKSNLARLTLGPIESGVIYPLDDFKARSGLGTAALRTARLEGLKVRYVGGRAYVAGDDFIAYVAEHGKAEK